MKQISMVVLWTMLVGSTAFGQVRMEINGNYENMFNLLLPSILTIIADDLDSGSILVVKRANIREPVPKKYADFDLQDGDVVMMVDGEHLESAADLKKFYEKVEVGQEVSLGVSRKDEVFVVTFEKPDPSLLPKIRTKRSGGPHGPSPDHSSQKPPL